MESLHTGMQYQINNILLITGAYLSWSEALDNIVPLRLRPLGVYDINVESIIDELMKQLLGSLNALDKHQHRRGKTLPIIIIREMRLDERRMVELKEGEVVYLSYDVSNGYQFSTLLANKQ